jgi:uncharacterized cupin superfamily protein
MDWRSINVLGAESVNLGAALGTVGFGARLWRFRPGEASLAHRHREEQELYVLLEGEGRIRIDREVLTLRPPAALVVDVDTVRQIFNDTPADQLWLLVGAPREQYRLADLSDEELGELYPYGLASLPPELRDDPSQPA